MNLRLLAILGWVILALVVGELALEVRAKSRGYSAPLLDWMDRPGTDGPLSASDGYGPTDEFPFRSRIVPPQRAEPTTRIWVASASHGAAPEFHPSEAFPGRLEHALRADGYAVEVLNASRVGLGIGDNARDLSEWGRQWSPDIVVLYQMSQDLNGISRRLSADGVNGSLEEPLGAAPAAVVSSKWSDPVVRAFESTVTYQQLRANVTPRLIRSQMLHDSIGARGLNEYRRRVLEFVAEVKAIGASPVLCTFAVSHAVRGDVGLPGHIELYTLRYNRYLKPSAWTLTLQQMNEVLRDIAEESDLVLIELEEPVNARADYFSDFVHFSATGHQLVGSIIAAGVRQNWSRLRGPAGE